jgi:hypothetical protein
MNGKMKWPRHDRHEETVEKEELTQLLAEYSALRAEILVTIQLRSHIQLSMLVALGTFLSLGIKESVGPTLMLCYPLLAFFLALEFARRDLRIAEIGDYIQYYIESRCPTIWWQRYFKQVQSTDYRFYWATMIGSMGTFVGSSIVALAITLLKSRNEFTWREWVLFGLGIVSCVLQVLVLRTRSCRHRPPGTAIEEPTPPFFSSLWSHLLRLCSRI